MDFLEGHVVNVLQQPKLRIDTVGRMRVTYIPSVPSQQLSISGTEPVDGVGSRCHAWSATQAFCCPNTCFLDLLSDFDAGMETHCLPQR